MNDNKDIVGLKNKHKGNFNTLWKIINLNKRLLKSIQIRISILVAVLLFALSIYNNINILEMINSLSGRIISLIPNILGFNLGGYVLFVGFNNETILKQISDNDDEGYSFYQHMSSIFAWSILVQAITLVIAFFISIIIDFNINSNCGVCINKIVIFLLFFLSVYSILLIVRIILNVFSLSQVIHFFVTTDNGTDSKKGK